MKHPLPTLGLGLSSNAQVTDVPRPYELLRRSPGAFDYLEYSAPLDVAVASREASLFAEMTARRHQLPLVYHPVHLNLFGPETETPARLEQLDRHCAEVASPWVSNDVAWWHERGAFLPGALYLSPPLTVDMLEVCISHARVVQRALHVPLLLENPTVLCARGPLHVLDFMERLSVATGCWLLLDVGHLVSHQLTRGKGLTHGLDDFDFSRVAQLHVAGGVITTRDGRQHYIDDHPQPVREEVWHLLELIAPRCTQLRAVTFEADGHPEAQALRGLERLRTVAPRPSTGESTPLGGSGAARTTFTAATHADACWQLFDDVHAGRGEDAAGARAEQDFRLAVLAQTLDAELPWARLGLAPTRTELLDFMTSNSFRIGFARGLPLRDVFLSWGGARRGALDGGAQRLLDFEAWLERQPRDSASLRPTGLATGVRLATFELDFSEVLFAVRALARHLRDRAPWSSAGYESSGFEGVWQAAGRAPRRAWTVALRPVGSRLDVFELSDDELAVMRQLETGASLDVPVRVAEGLLRRGLVTRSGP